MLVGRKDVKITRDEAIRYLFRESSVMGGIVSSVLSSVLGFLITYFIIKSAKMFGNMITGRHFIILILIFLLVGVVLYFIKREEFVLYEKTNSQAFMHGILSYPVYIIIFTGIFLYYFIPQWATNQAGEEMLLLSSIVTILLVSVIFAFLFNAIWKITDFYILQLFSKKDWFILAQRDRFVSGIGLRFEESRRYGTSLSLLNVKIGIPNKKKKILESMYNKIKKALRDIDSMSHYENWNDIVILVGVTDTACHGLFVRIVNIIKEELFARGIKDSIEVQGRISTVTSDTESEFDLLQPKEILKETISIGS